MQKTLEILKSEDGLTICKLSHKKWLFKINLNVSNEIHLDKKFSLITEFTIFDKQWIRDFKIKKLTNEINKSK